MALRFYSGGSDNPAYTLASVNMPSGGAHSFTLRAYVAPTAVAACELLYGDTSGGSGASGPTDGFSWLGVINIGGAYAWIYNEWLSTTEVLNFMQPFEAGAWVHISLVYSGTAFTAYFNGAQVYTVAGSVSGRANFNYLDMGYGRDFTVQDVNVFTKALTAAEVAALANQRVTAAQGSSLYAWLPMRLTDADQKVDASGNGHNLAAGALAAADAPGIFDSQITPSVGGVATLNTPRIARGLAARRKVR